jgi:hypothetical protein
MMPVVLNDDSTAIFWFPAKTAGVLQIFDNNFIYDNCSCNKRSHQPYLIVSITKFSIFSEWSPRHTSSSHNAFLKLGLLSKSQVLVKIS